MTLTDAVIAAAGEIVETLHSHMHPSMTETIIQALKSVKDIFQEAADANKFADIKLTSGPL